MPLCGSRKVADLAKDETVAGLEVEVQLLKRSVNTILSLRVVVAIVFLVLAAAVGQEEDQIRTGQVILTILLTLLSGLYGTYQEDRGWLMVNTIMEFMLINTATSFFYMSADVLRSLSTGCAVPSSKICDSNYSTITVVFACFAILLFLLTVAACWLVMTLGEKIQDRDEKRRAYEATQAAAKAGLKMKQLRRRRGSSFTGTGSFSDTSEAQEEEVVQLTVHTPASASAASTPRQDAPLVAPRMARAKYALSKIKFDIPDQTLEMLTKWTLCAATVSFVTGILLVSVSWMLTAGAQANQVWGLALSTSVGAAFATYGAWRKSRVSLQLAFTLNLWDLSKVMPMVFYYLVNVKEVKEQCHNTGLNCSSPHRVAFALFVLVLSFVSLIVLSWLTSRLSEKQQEHMLSQRNLKDEATAVCGMPLYQALTRAMVVLAIVELALGFTVVGTGLNTARDGNPVFFWYFAGALITMAVLVFYAAVQKSRGCLTFLFIICVWMVSSGWEYVSLSFEEAAGVAKSCQLSFMYCSAGQQGNYLWAYQLDAAVIVLFIVGGVVLACVSFVLNEQLQEGKHIANQADEFAGVDDEVTHTKNILAAWGIAL